MKGIKTSRQALIWKFTLPNSPRRAQFRYLRSLHSFGKVSMYGYAALTSFENATLPHGAAISGIMKGWGRIGRCRLPYSMGAREQAPSSR
jgi:hypothetical protein